MSVTHTLKQAIPDRIFHSFEALKSGVWQTWCSSKMSFDGFWGSEIAKCSVGNARLDSFYPLQNKLMGIACELLFFFPRSMSTRKIKWISAWFWQLWFVIPRGRYNSSLHNGLVYGIKLLLVSLKRSRCLEALWNVSSPPNVGFWAAALKLREVAVENGVCFRFFFRYLIASVSCFGCPENGLE